MTLLSPRVSGVGFADPADTELRRVSALAVAALVVIALAASFAPIGPGQFGGGIHNLRAALVLAMVVAGLVFASKRSLGAASHPAALAASIRARPECARAWWCLAATGAGSAVAIQFPVAGPIAAGVVAVNAFIAGALSAAASNRLPDAALEVREAVARGLGVSARELRVAWAGSVREPGFLVRLPFSVPERSRDDLVACLEQELRGYYVDAIRAYSVEVRTLPEER